MRSLPILKHACAGLAAGLFGGCLVSEEPVLSAENGKAAALKDGFYAACETEERGEDCDVFHVARGEGGAYTFEAEDEDPTVLRFRRIGAKAYAVQSAEEDGYAYYYGAGDEEEFSLTMMQCEDLPEKLRARLISKGDLSTEDEDFQTCTVNTVKGLVAAARAYHRGKTTGDDDAAIVLTPVTDETEE